MMVKKVFLSLFLVIMLTGITAKVRADNGALIKKVQPSLFFILDKDGNREGNGWCIADGLVETDAHVIRGIDNPLILNSDKEGNFGEVVYQNSPEEDVAFIKINGHCPPLIINAHEPKENEMYNAFPLRGESQPSFLFPTERNGQYLAGAIYQGVITLAFNMPTSENGDSGSPIFNSNGEVVGVILGNGKIEGLGIQNTVLAEPSVSIKILLEKYLSQQKK